MIDYVSANDGKIELYTADANVFASANPMELANFIMEVGFAEDVFGSSSMDFAAEYGFETNEGAAHLLGEAVARVNLFTEGTV